MNNNIKYAIVVTIIFIVWIVSGLFMDPAKKTIKKSDEETPIQQVVVRTLETEMYNKEIKIVGETMADNRVTILARTAGVIQSFTGQVGDFVKKDQVLAKIDEEDRAQIVKAALANVNKTKLDYDATKKLSQQGYNSQSTLSAKQVNYEEAVRDYKKALQDLEYTNIKAPFDGKIEKRLAVVEGQYVSISTQLYEIVGAEKIKAVGYISQKNRPLLKEGSNVSVKLVTGELLNGKISFLSNVSEVGSRTFRVEVILDNKGKMLPIGATATIEATAFESIKGVFVPSSALILDNDGTLGVMIEENGKAKFLEANIETDNDKGVFIKANKDVVNLIIAGQYAVTDGSDVKVFSDNK